MAETKNASLALEKNEMILLKHIVKGCCDWIWDTSGGNLDPSVLCLEEFLDQIQQQIGPCRGDGAKQRFWIKTEATSRTAFLDILDSFLHAVVRISDRIQELENHFEHLEVEKEISNEIESYGGHDEWLCSMAERYRLDEEDRKRESF